MVIIDAKVSASVCCHCLLFIVLRRNRKLRLFAWLWANHSKIVGIDSISTRLINVQSAWSESNNNNLYFKYVCAQRMSAAHEKSECASVRASFPLVVVPILYVFDRKCMKTRTRTWITIPAERNESSSGKRNSCTVEIGERGSNGKWMMSSHAIAKHKRFGDLMQHISLAAAAAAAVVKIKSNEFIGTYRYLSRVGYVSDDCWCWINRKQSGKWTACRGGRKNGMDSTCPSLDVIRFRTTAHRLISVRSRRVCVCARALFPPSSLLCFSFCSVRDSFDPIRHILSIPRKLFVAFTECSWIVHTQCSLSFPFHSLSSHPSIRAGSRKLCHIIISTCSTVRFCIQRRQRRRWQRWQRLRRHYPIQRKLLNWM